MSKYTQLGQQRKESTATSRLHENRIIAAASLALAMILPGCWAEGPQDQSLEANRLADPAGVSASVGPRQSTATQSLVGSPGAPTIYFDRNFSNTPLALFPGVTVASLTLPPGNYMMNAKFRYRGSGTAPSQASCVYQSELGNIGGLDASENSGTIATGSVDGFLMDMFSNNTQDNVEVHVQCFGPAGVSIINPQFMAISTTLIIML